MSFYQSGIRTHSILCQMTLHHLLCSRLVTHPDKNSQALRPRVRRVWLSERQMTNQENPSAQSLNDSSTDTVTLIDNRTGRRTTLPILDGTAGPSVIDVRNLYAKAGYFTFDPGFTATELSWTMSVRVLPTVQRDEPSVWGTEAITSSGAFSYAASSRTSSINRAQSSFRATLNVISSISVYINQIPGRLFIHTASGRRLQINQNCEVHRCHSSR